MAEKHNLKIEVLAPTGIEAEVPRHQILRAPENPTSPNDSKAEIPMAAHGDGDGDWNNPGALLRPVYVGEPVRPPPRRRRQDHGSLEDKTTPEEKLAKTRIPVSRFKTAVDKVQRERKHSKEQKNKKQAPEKPPRHSSIPKLSDRILAARKNAYKTDVSDQNDKNKDEDVKIDTSDTKTVKADDTYFSRQDSNILREGYGENIEFMKTETAGSKDKEITAQANEKLEDEFDKLYDEIVDEEVDIIPDEILNTKVKDPEKLEIKFEEIMHQYDESVNVEPADKARYSKIPLLKRRSVQDIKVPKQSERRLSLKTSNDKMIHQQPASSDTSKYDNDKQNKTVENSMQMDRISENNNDHSSKIHDIQSESELPPAYDIMATPDAELVKVGLVEASQKHNVDQNKNSDDIVASQIETATASNLDESNETKVTQDENNHSDFEEVKAEYTIEEPISITEDSGLENDKAGIIEISNNSIVSDVINQNNTSDENTAITVNQDDVKIATTNFDISISDEGEIAYKQQGNITPIDNEFKSVKLLKNSNRVEERTKSRFINKPLQKENDINPTKLEVDIPLVRGKVSRILNRLTSQENARNYERNNEPDEQIETKKDDQPSKRNVNKILNRIMSLDIEQSRKNEFNEPEKKSVLSKIAMFERPDPEPIIAKTSTVKYSKPQRTISEEIKHSPKIVHEVLKPSMRDVKTDKPFEVVNIDILKPVEVITSEEQVLVIEDLKEQSIVYENLDNTKQDNPVENKPSDYQTTTDNDVTVSNDNRVIKQEPSVEAKKPIQDLNKSTNNLEAIDNRLNSVDPKVEHFNNRGASSRYVPVKEKINKLQAHEESNMRKAKSTAELDLGDAVKGKVRNMIYRMNSYELLDDNINNKQKETISVKERPRKRSVSEKIALFERKLTAVKMEAVETRSEVDTKPVPTVASVSDDADEEFQAKVQELLSARSKYGVTNATVLELADGSKMPALALGTALLEPRLTKYIVAAAIDLGFRAIDTAFIYGNEKEVGEGIRTKIQDGTVKREDLFIMSKLWSTFHQPELVEPACRASLRALGLDYFDLFMIHNPMSFKEGGDPIPRIAGVVQYSRHEYLDAWHAMERLPAALARRLGVSNFNSTQLARLLDRGRVPPLVNQVECHPYLSQQRLSSFCEERGVRLSCFGTLGSKGTPAALRGETAAALDDPLVRALAAGLGVSPAQLLISYQLQRGHAAVVKASSAAHLWDALQAPRAPLAPAQLRALSALDRNRRTYTFKGMGDTHRHYPFQGPF